MHQTICSKCNGAERCYQADIERCVSDSCLHWRDDSLIRELLLITHGPRLIVFQCANQSHSSRDTCFGETSSTVGQGRWHMKLLEPSMNSKPALSSCRYFADSSNWQCHGPHTGLDLKACVIKLMPAVVKNGVELKPFGLMKEWVCLRL